MNVQLNNGIQRIIIEYCEYKPKFINELENKTKDIFEFYKEAPTDIQRMRQYDTGEIITFVIKNQMGNWLVRTKLVNHFGPEDKNRYSLFQREIKCRTFVIKNLVMNSCYMFY